MLTVNSRDWRTPRDFQERRWICLEPVVGCMRRPVIVNDKGDARCVVHADSEDFAVASVVQGKLD